MHLLLIAYDFPPTPSPQSLRWAYLVRELSAAGHTVQVIAPDIPGYGPGGLPCMPEGLEIHRVDPGRFARLLMGRNKRLVPNRDVVGSAQALVQPVLQVAPQPLSELNWKGRLRRRIESSIGAAGGLNWKGALAEKAKAAVSRHVFPDHRVEWVRHAVDELDMLIAARRPDVVIVSHEPACSLPVGLAAAKRGLPLVVDMGDPVLAPYTPNKWRKQAYALEQAVCNAAMMISVTNEGAAQTLQERHAIPGDKLLVVPQGFDSCYVATAQERMVHFDESRLELLYTGSFYSFRRAEDVLDAVRAVPGVRLTIATINAPRYLIEAAEMAPESIRLIGFMPHRAALAAQRDCDVLLNLANADPVQVPGKVFEYLGAGKPILHLRGQQQDATGEILMRMGAGWQMASERALIEQVLLEMKELKAQDQLSHRVADGAQAADYAWSALAAKWSERLGMIIAHKNRGIAA